MRLLRLFALSAIAVAAACAASTDGTLVTPDPLAGLRYVNLVADTGAVDFRVIDIVENAPNQVAAAFRTGGNPAGFTAPAGTMPWYQGVEAGTRHIRVFMNGTTAAVASQIVFDTVVTFTAGQNYTFYLYGYARTGQTPRVNALITTDAVQSIPTATTAITQTATSGTLTSITTTTNTIVAASGSWITQGVKVGDMVVLTNHATAANNSLRLGVAAVTASTITIASANLIATAVPDSAFTLTIQSAKFAVRVIDLAASTAGTVSLAGNVADVFVDTLGAAVTPPAGSAKFTTVNFFEQRPYTQLVVNSGLNYRAAIAASGTATPFIQGDVPNGTVGTATANPIPGDLVAGTALTIIITPRAVAGSGAVPSGNPAAFQSPALAFVFDQLPPRTAP
jgi:hypothetical protein